LTSKRTTRITIQRDRVWIIRRCGSLVRNRCEGCGAEAEFVSVEQAIALTGRTAEEIKQSVLAAKLHTSSAGGEAMRICLRRAMPIASAIPSSRFRFHTIPLPATTCRMAQISIFI